MEMLMIFVGLLAGLLSSGVNAQACSTSTIASAVPTATSLALNEYSYCGGPLTTRVYVENLDYDKIVSLYYSDASDNATPLTVLSLGYQSSTDNNFEFWGSTTTGINVDGIKRLLNITYQATDIGVTNVEQLNLKVTASGPAPPTTTAPVPYATPTGFSRDITRWLRVAGGTQIPLAKKLMFNNIEPTNSVSGSIVAAQSYDNPDYGYNWVRDSSLTMDVVASLFRAATNDASKKVYQGLFFRYALRRANEQNSPALTGLGEPKWNLDGTDFTGPWGRPQNDGRCNVSVSVDCLLTCNRPATAAIALMEFSNAFLDNGGDPKTIDSSVYNAPNRPLRKDLLFVSQNWTSPSFDLWEEEESMHCYTRMVQHRAMVMGSAFARRLGDAKTANALATVGRNIAATLPSFFNTRRNLILYEIGPVLANKASFKDVAVMLGAIHGYAGDGIYSFSYDQMLASVYQIATSFLDVYPIAAQHKNAEGLTLGIPVGRYPEDVYDGVGTSRGNPWYLCTAATAEHFYRASTELRNARSITVTKVSEPFWTYFSPQSTVIAGHTYGANTTQYKTMIASLQGWGDAFMRTVQYYTPVGGHLSEEIDRGSGEAVGAIDLTWSYAALLTASFARAEAIGNPVYITNLANMATTTNATGPGVA